MLVRSTRLAAFALASFACACGPQLKYYSFPVDQAGQRVEVRKFWNDGFGVDEAERRAFDAARSGNRALAITLVKDESSARVFDPWAHYDLGILYEADAEWDKALLEMREGQRLDASTKRGKADSMFGEEISFIEEHRRR